MDFLPWIIATLCLFLLIIILLKLKKQSSDLSKTKEALLELTVKKAGSDSLLEALKASLTEQRIKNNKCIEDNASLHKTIENLNHDLSGNKIFIEELKVSLAEQRFENNKYLEDNASLHKTIENLNHDLSENKSHLEALSKYKEVYNIEEKAKTLVEESEQKSASILMAAETILNQANEKALKIIDDAQKESQSLNEKARNLLDNTEKQTKEAREAAFKESREIRNRTQNLLDDATKEAGKIIGLAKIKAREIAGSAYDALNNKEHLENAVAALKNLINGYGDRYVIPIHSILDDLAEEFTHTDAGNKLKNARTRTKFMVENNTAATCDYVEAYRREIAIRFVTDAFNGKVDTIIARLKHDNLGTLQQEVRDAYALVNLNGGAFRSARITPEYLDSRLDELNWAAIIYELKLREREEQRIIKEQMREEERARREYEKALRDAEKEEERILKALEKARKEVEKAGEEQKAKYEIQINELLEKLKEAEDKNQRALSMAQQTKSGHVYIISNIGSFGDEVFKIGMTRRLEPLDRVKELGDASVPFEFDVHAMVYSEDAPALESSLHKIFNDHRVNKVNYRKEFFRVGIADIRENITGLGFDPKFTMVAEAREYRESLAFVEKSKTEQAEQLKHLLELEMEGSGSGGE